MPDLPDDNTYRKPHVFAFREDAERIVSNQDRPLMVEFPEHGRTMSGKMHPNGHFEETPE